MASKRQLSLIAEALRWNIMEMLALEEELDSGAKVRPDVRERGKRRLDFLRSESLQQVGELTVGLEAWRRGVTMPASSA